jgi:hypothetical protein
VNALQFHRRLFADVVFLDEHIKVFLDTLIIEFMDNCESLQRLYPTTAKTLRKLNELIKECNSFDSQGDASTTAREESTTAPIPPDYTQHSPPQKDTKTQPSYTSTPIPPPQVPAPQVQANVGNVKQAQSTVSSKPASKQESVQVPAAAVNSDAKAKDKKAGQPLQQTEVNERNKETIPNAELTAGADSGKKKKKKKKEKNEGGNKAKEDASADVAIVMGGDDVIASSEAEIIDFEKKLENEWMNRRTERPRANVTNEWVASLRQRLQKQKKDGATFAQRIQP